MNAHALYKNLGPYEPIHQDSMLLCGEVSPIGATTIRRRLASGPAYEERTLARETGFDARENLLSVLRDLHQPTEPATIAAASSALARMEQRRAEDIDEWSNTLSGDLASACD